jgi:hypothetical protein
MGDATMDMSSLLVQLVSGAVGGNLGGALLKNLSLGTLGNSIAGIVGGGLGGQILGALMGGGAAATGGMGPVLSNVAGGGVGGIVVMIVVALIKRMMNKPSS